jgi:hypothetical protein
MNSILKKILLWVALPPLALVALGMHALVIGLSVGSVWAGATEMGYLFDWPTHFTKIVVVLLLILIHILAVWGWIYIARENGKQADRIRRDGTGFTIYFCLCILLALILTTFYYANTGTMTDVLPPGLKGSWSLLLPYAVWLGMVFVGLRQIAGEFYSERDA